MNWDLQGWPASARTAVLSLLVIAGAYVIGRVAKHIVATQLASLARRTGNQWIDPVAGAVARRVPFWSVLVGIYIAAGFWILPEKIANALDKGLYVVAAASLTLLASEVLVKFVRIHGPAIDPSPPTTTLTENLVRIVVVILGLLVILAGLDLEITPILTALGVGGLAVALALQDTLANLFAGFYLTVAKHIRIGNYIKLSSGEEGYLVDIDWRASRLRQLTNNTVLVPNAKLSQSIVTNYDSPDHEIVVTIEASVDYVSDLDQRRADRDRGRARRDAHRAGRRARFRSARAVPYIRRPGHRLFRDSPRAEVRGSVPDQARVRKTAAEALPLRRHHDSHQVARSAAGRAATTAVSHGRS